MKDLLSSVHFDRTPLRRISLPDIDTHIHYLHMDSFSSYNMYYFKLYYKDNAPVPFITTNDMYTDFKLPVHHLLTILFKYKTTPSSISYSCKSITLSAEKSSNIGGTVPASSPVRKQHAIYSHFIPHCFACRATAVCINQISYFRAIRAE